MSPKILVYFLFLVIVSPVLADSLELEIVTENWRPYNYSEGGDIKGHSTEILEKVLRRSGIKYKIKVYPWARAYKIAQNRKNVLIYTIMRIPSREYLFKWIILFLVPLFIS